MMLDDDDYNESIRGIITEQSVNAQYAVSVTCENFAQMFTQMSDPYMQARAADVKDISGRLIACMDEDMRTIDSDTDKMIVIADDLSPSETVVLDKDRVLAFVTAGGSPNSHTAILARNMNIPAVIGVGDEILQKVRDGQTVVVDGSTGEIIVQPDEEAIALEQFADTHHEAILRLIEMSAKNAHASGAWIGICGELAADLSLTETFLRMGIDELSVSAPFVLPLREKIRSLDLSK